MVPSKVGPVRVSYGDSASGGPSLGTVVPTSLGYRGSVVIVDRVHEILIYAEIVGRRAFEPSATPTVEPYRRLDDSRLSASNVRLERVHERAYRLSGREKPKSIEEVQRRDLSPVTVVKRGIETRRDVVCRARSVVGHGEIQRPGFELEVDDNVGTSEKPRRPKPATHLYRLDGEPLVSELKRLRRWFRTGRVEFGSDQPDRKRAFHFPDRERLVFLVQKRDRQVPALDSVELDRVHPLVELVVAGTDIALNVDVPIPRAPWRFQIAVLLRDAGSVRQQCVVDLKARDGYAVGYHSLFVLDSEVDPATWTV